MKREERKRDRERRGSRDGERCGSARRTGEERGYRETRVGVGDERERKAHETREEEERERCTGSSERLGGKENAQKREALARTEGRGGDGQEAGQEGSEHGESLA